MSLVVFLLCIARTPSSYQEHIKSMVPLACLFACLFACPGESVKYLDILRIPGPPSDDVVHRNMARESYNTDSSRMTYGYLASEVVVREP